MVVVCESCRTRFHLADARVPAKGIQVRCSRCEHAFFIVPSGAGKDEIIDEVVAEVTGPGNTPIPAVAQDLADGNRDGAGEGMESATGSEQPPVQDHGLGDIEEDWEFNDDSLAEIDVESVPELSEFDDFEVTPVDPAEEASESELATDPPDSIGEPEPAPLTAEEPAPLPALEPEPPPAQEGATPPAQEPTVLPPQEATVLPAQEAATPFTQEPARDPVEAIRAREAELDFSSPDSLGSPEEWDFVGTAEFEHSPEPDPEPVVEPAEEVGPASPTPASAQTPTAPVESAPVPLMARLGGLASITGWILVGLAFSMGMSGVLTQPPVDDAVESEPAEISVSGVAVTASGVESRLVENALVGNLLVVSGELENGGSRSVAPGRAIQVQLVSATGKPVEGATAAAGLALPRRKLRERDPELLRRDLERSAAVMAHRFLRPGERVRFDAVFESVPESAAGWVLRAATLPARPDPGASLPSAAPLAWE